MSAGLACSRSHHFLHFNPIFFACPLPACTSFRSPPPPNFFRNPFVLPLLFGSKCSWFENSMSRSRKRKSEVWGSDFRSQKFPLDEAIWNVWFYDRAEDIIVGWYSAWQWEHGKTIGQGMISFMSRTRRLIVQALWATPGLGCLCFSCLIPLTMKVPT